MRVLTSDDAGGSALSKMGDGLSGAALGLAVLGPEASAACLIGAGLFYLAAAAFD